MSSLQDTPQQALAGWLLKNGGEKAIEKMADDLFLAVHLIELFMVPDSGVTVRTVRAVAIALYTDGEVIFPHCPVWAVEKVKGLSHG